MADRDGARPTQRFRAVALWVGGHVWRRLPITWRSKLQPIRSALERENPFTGPLIARYCVGRGIEVGPGLKPYGPTGRTVMLERFALRLGTPTVTDVVADGVALPVQPCSMDFVISSHMLEHHPDPLAVLHEWTCALRPGGVLALILPHADRTWDRGRPMSDLAHLQTVHGRPHDPDAPINWDDYERFSLSVLHPWFDDPESRTPDGAWNRRWIDGQGFIHYHAWTHYEMVEVVQSMGMRVRAVLDELPDRNDSFLIVAERIAE